MSLLRRIFIIFLTLFVCYTHGQLDCKITNLGIEYVGLKNVTMSGFTCQAWSSQYPHKHSLSEYEILRKSRNYCRHTKGYSPWCYTTNRNVRWEDCGIPFCPITDDKCYEEGTFYLGKINVTETGYPCRRWDSEDSDVYQVFGQLENYCRSPDGAPFPWCLSTAPGKIWEKCRIPICGSKTTPTIPTTIRVKSNQLFSNALTDDECYEEGITYLGKINVTETGYACRRWDSEDSDVYQAFGQLENYCRSPDGAPFPWCLSTAPGKRWEKCRIPICGGKTTPTIPTTISVKSNQLFSNAITDDNCYEEGKGNAYHGKINVTETGYACRRWDSEAKKEYQMFHLENYCRSPNGAPFPWCLSTAPGKIWEKCQIPICDADTSPCWQMKKRRKISSIGFWSILQIVLSGERTPKLL